MINDQIDPGEFQRLRDLIDGDPRKGIKGLRNEMNELRTIQEEFMKEWSKMKTLLVGISIGMVVTSGGTFVVLSRILAALAGGGLP